MRVALVSCVKSKRSVPTPAGDLYTSTLFLGLRRYAEANADRWYILSAKHGLLDPSEVVAPYEQTLNKMPASARRDWAEEVNSELARVLPADAEVIVLAGERYREGVVPFLRRRGHGVSVPLEGLPFGKQLQFLARGGSVKRSGGTRHPLGAASLELPDSVSGGAPTRVEFDSGRVLSDLTSRTAVLAAMAECDRLGREAFLEKYGFGPARRYFLEHNSRHYDSKAIVGAAYGHQFPDRGPLQSSEFSGGQNTVRRRLEDLGFSLVVLPDVAL